MILATLREGGPDGTLIVVNRARTKAVRAEGIAITLQAALDTWVTAEPQLLALAEHLERDDCPDVFALDLSKLAAPLPRGFAFYDAACYPEHISIIRKARGATLPADFLEQPMMYQAVASPILSWCDPIKVADDVGYGVDLEAEIVVITGEVPSGTKANEAAGHIKLLGLLNDVSLRNIVAPELARGFGFLHSKSDKAMGPFVVTPDELGNLWNGSMFTGGRYLIGIRGERLGELDPGKDVVFNYCDLIQHAAKTRILVPGTMIGAGTLANKDGKTGSGCIAEQRAREQLTRGEMCTGYLRYGDELYLEMFDLEGRSIFGPIRQKLAPLDKS
ncbi:fumarylacetoacetate hydrolase family protein [Pseudomonas aeruginosa]|uniref:fumarylacetoacetate hydrolase family protein n=1 Tax=Pseudomonas aeruginosa TaxID=287 RepID=UPI001555679B|nr:fumarylacetoacetate hydrolase family protein [Pseudomonas aeruginosa]QKF01630.1 FAA hydrolase family protein [Pseudomonas aeruginosa]HCF1525225.1 fumarylacetoacetate hydrolase family protein [Pseudomonas aeruginosa]